MGTVRKTITLTEQQNSWIAERIEDGAYTTDSEAIRDLIRREQERSMPVNVSRSHPVVDEQAGDVGQVNEYGDEDETHDDDLDDLDDEDEDYGLMSDPCHDPDHTDNDPRPRDERDVPWSDVTKC